MVLTNEPQEADIKFCMMVGHKHTYKFCILFCSINSYLLYLTVTVMVTM